MTPFGCLVADPPWRYDDQMAAMTTTGGGAATHYGDMSEADICGFVYRQDGRVTVWGHDVEVAADAHLWLWFTNAFAEAAHHVARAWGFTPKTIATWVKGRLLADAGEATGAALVQHVGQGHYLRNTTEHVLFAVRGRCPARVHNLPTAFVYPARWPGRLHSEKPPVVHEWAELMSPGPYLELFARKRRPGWTAIGNQLEPERSEA